MTDEYKAYRGPCACMGPRGGEPLCPCHMALAREYLNKPPTPPELKDRVINAIKAYIEHPGLAKGWNALKLQEAITAYDEGRGND